MGILLLILFPLLGSILNGLVLRSRVPARAGAIATTASFLSFVTSLCLWRQLSEVGHPLVFSYPWLNFTDWTIAWSFVFDPLTAVMATMVTGIGTLIHLYSIGYMSEEPSPYRYFAYLNLFLMNMLVLLTAGNLLVLFVGWEGVGLCSYLLIGYWYDDLRKSNAGMKAFIVNRIGDAGFLIGIFLCLQLFRTVEFSAISKILYTSQVSLRDLGFIGLCLFIGAIGKSAQIPLYVWLPDAMAGPTPVSALIHAATMVTAGVYLIARTSFLYELLPAVSLSISVIGISTSLLAALIATSLRDIKKVLAYSTISQLGLMFLALGCHAYIAAIFHVLTHAFFKALLFLGAGSVIHGLHGEQDIWEMGGLRKKMPWTCLTFGIATLAISGIPPLAGFFSKDSILFAALSRDAFGKTLWILGLTVSLLTAFYMTRVFTLVFLGESRNHHTEKAHESPWVMLFPLAILALGSIFSGIIGFPEDWGILPNYLNQYLKSTVVLFPESGHPPVAATIALLCAISVGVLGTLVGYFFYVKPSRAEKAGKWFLPLRLLSQNQFWIDDLYRIIFVRPFLILSGWFARFFDKWVIDGLCVFPSHVTRFGSVVLSFVQIGNVSLYLFWMLLGGIGIIWYCMGGFVR